MLFFVLSSFTSFTQRIKNLGRVQWFDFFFTEDDLHKIAMVLARLPTKRTDKIIATNNFCILFYSSVHCFATTLFESTFLNKLSLSLDAVNLFKTNFSLNRPLPVYKHSLRDCFLAIEYLMIVKTPTRLWCGLTHYCEDVERSLETPRTTSVP